MRIQAPVLPDAPAPATPVRGVETAAPLPVAEPPALASRRLDEARKRLAELPEIDAARVAEVKAALARGEVQLDPEKLARTIRQYHGSRG